MNYFSLLFLSLLCTSEIIRAQEPSASEILENAISYHDPNGSWERFNSTFRVTMTTPNNPKRVSDITINLPGENFNLKAVQNGKETRYTLDKEKCTTNIVDTLQPADARKPCETAKLYKNYYTYLYGLPMKLKDHGTQISDEVKRVTFNGKEYLQLKVTYDEAVGSDVWFFYFDPKTYAMEVYQFFKGDPKGSGKDTGEYILLSEEATVQGIKMPKVRAWHYNKDDNYLGTDTITEK